MKLIGFMYLLSFCSYLSATPINVTSEISMLIRRIIWTNWNQSNIEFNLDAILDTPEMIRKAGYLAESHVVMTEDGYRLTLHRIPGGNDSLPVLLQHGFISSSADWVVLGKNKAFAYLLADQGYDVWMGNFRGNIYSRAHISLSSSNSTFWDFSFHETGIYDLPAMITFITNMRAQPLHTYIGYSMSATSFFIMASERPKVARMVQMMIGLAPAVFVNHMKSPIQYFFQFRRELKMVAQLFFHDEVFGSDSVRFLLKNICDQNITGEFCVNLMSIICGDDREQFNYDLLPVILNNFPAGISTKTILHFIQAFESGKFRKYDYGRVRNLLIYNSMKPPNYNLSNTKVPIALFYGDNDWFVSTEDVKRLAPLLPNVVDMYKVPWSKFNHVGFIWAKDASKLVYDRILKIMREENLNIVTSVK